MKDTSSKWPPSVKRLAKELHGEVTINDRDWHRFKNDSERRSAELLASALSQIVNDGNNSDVELLIRQALRWIKNELKDPGCPSH